MSTSFYLLLASIVMFLCGILSGNRKGLRIWSFLFLYYPFSLCAMLIISLGEIKIVFPPNEDTLLIIALLLFAGVMGENIIKNIRYRE